MPPHLKSVGLVLALVGSGAISPFVPILNSHAGVSAQTQTAAPSAERQSGSVQQLLAIAKQHYRRAEFKRAISLYQQALAKAQTEGDDTTQMEALLQLGAINQWVGQITQAEERFQQVIKLAREKGDRAREGEALVWLADVYRNRQEFPNASALVQQALAIAQQTNDRKLEAQAYLAQGATLVYRQELQKAIEPLQKALALAKEIQAQEEIAYTYTFLSLAHAGLKNLKQAEAVLSELQKFTQVNQLVLLEYSSLQIAAAFRQQQNQPEQVLQIYRKQFQIAQSADNSWFQRSTLLEMGWFYVNQKQIPKALETYQQALKLAKTIDDPAVADVQNRIGVAYYNGGQYFKAIEFYQQALATYPKTQDNQMGIAQVWINIGDVCWQLKEYSKSLEALQQALVIYQQLKNENGLGDTQRRIGNVFYRMEQYSKAVESYQQALATYQKLNQQLEIAQVWLNIGNAYKWNKQYSQALEAYGRSRAIYQESDKRIDKAYVLREIARTHHQLKDANSAIKVYLQALEIFRQELPKLKEKGDSYAVALTLWELGNRYHDQKQYEQALRVYEESLAAYQGSPADEADVLRSLSNLYRQLGQTDKATQTFQEARKKNEAAIKYRTNQSKAPEQLIELTGIWQINPGKSTNGQSYTGTVTVGQVNQRYGLLWETSLGAYSGIGLVEDGQFFASWGTGTTISYGLVIYAISEDGSLDGWWADGMSGTGTEKATSGKPGQIEGDYKVLGTNYDGSTYSGNLKIQKTGDVYQFFWNTGTEYRGVGIRVGNRLVVSWGRTNANPGVVAYEIKGDRLLGKQTLIGQTKVATEILVRNQIPNQNAQQKIEVLQLQKEADKFLGEGEIQLAITRLQKAVTVAQGLRDPKSEANLLRSLGGIYLGQEQFLQALKYNEQALKKYQVLNDNYETATTLNTIGIILFRQGHFTQSRDFYQQALAISRNLKEYSFEGTLLSNIGKVYVAQGEYSKALKLLDQALIIHRQWSNQVGEGATLDTIGLAYSEQGEYQKALENYQLSLAVHRKAGQITSIGITERNIGIVHANQGSYQKALEAYEQSLQTIRSVLPKNRAEEATTLSRIGLVYSDLGLFGKALDYYQKALSVYMQLGYRASEGRTLNTISRAYVALRQYDKALKLYQQSLAITQSVGDVSTESEVLYGIGLLHKQQFQPQLALDALQKALALQQKISVLPKEAITLSQIGQIQTTLNSFSESQLNLQRSLTIAQKLGDRPTEAMTLASLAQLFANQQQSELAIVFYKQSVKLTEDIRKDIRTLPKDQQQSYTETVAGTYRQLADLLLKRDRVLEAQQVLDLLKLQELNDYLRNVRGEGQKLYELPPEREILKKYNALNQSAITLLQELNNLQDIARSGKSLTPAQEKRKEQLLQLQKDLTQQFNDFATKDPDVLASLKQLSPTEIDVTIPLKDLAGFSKELAKLDAVMLYPLVLDNRLELIITAPNAKPLRRTVNVTREELNQTIKEFRTALQNPTLDAKPAAQKLYTWLIKPIEADLKAAQPKTIIYAPDGQLRYIPLAALHDGKQWLVQQYAINNITSKAVDELTQKPEGKLRVLAGAFGTADKQVNFAGQFFPFRGLAFTVKEVKALAKRLPAITEFLGPAFTPKAVTNKMNEYTIVHLATHASLAPEVGSSFIVFGDGTAISLSDIDGWTLDAVDLIVLSACETGLGGRFGKNGEEVLGLGYQFTKKDKAKAAIASLWSVNDGGTQALMDDFYAELLKGRTKSEALRQAQIALINGKEKSGGGNRATLVARWQGQLPAEVINQLNHPYYWAPFILIGNGL